MAEDNNAVIGRVIAKYAPEGWQKAWISATVEDGYVGNLTADYVDGDGKEAWFDIANAGDVMDLSNALLALREQLRQERQEPFSACTFTLSRDGTFKLDADYADQAAG